MTATDTIGIELARLLATAVRPAGAPRLALATLGTRDELTIDEPPVPAGTIPVFLTGDVALLGPLGTGGGNGPACPRCLARRWQAARQKDLRDALETGGGTATAVGPSPFGLAFVADGLYHLVDAFRASDSALVGNASVVYQVQLGSLGVRRFGVVPDADCPRCGRRVDDDPALAALPSDPAPKPAPEEFRTRPLDDYDLDVAAFVNPVCGALGASLWQDVTSLSTAPVIGSFTLRTGPYLRETLFGGHADDYRDSARIGVLEGLERAAGLRPRGKNTTVTASLDELGDTALDPRVCGVYRDEFYDANPYVQRFDPVRPIRWVWGASLRDDRPILVPENLVYYHAGPVEERFVQETSNGCASGSSLVEAAYHGLMEAVERDAFLLTWYGRRSCPEIDPRTSTRPRTRFMVDRLAMYGYDARFFDIRTSFDIPIVTGVAVRRDGGLGTLAFGGGASLDPEAAMSAALCEIATDSVMVRVRAGADEARLRPMIDDFDLVRGLHDHPLLYGLPEMRGHAEFLIGTGGTPRSVADTYVGTPPPAEDLRDDLERCVKQVSAQGFDVIVVDQTLPEQRDLGLHTVSVMVPGLLPIDFGWMRQRAPHAPRLRTAFREAGLLDRDLRPDEINPAPHPFP